MPAFDVYQSVGPNVDVSLFGDAAKTGAALGQAIPNPITSAITGAEQGYKYGLDVEAERLQNIQRQHQIEQQPTADQQAQATLEHTRAETEKLKAEAKAKEDVLLAETQRMEIKVRNEKATDELRTLGVFNKIDDGFKSSNIRDVIDTINSPDGASVLRSKPDLAFPIFSKLDQLKVDKNQYEPLRQSIVSAMREEAAAKRTTAMAGSDEKQADKETEAFKSGRSDMRAVYGELALSPSMDPRKAFVGVRGGVTADGRYIVPNPLNRMERIKAGVPKEYADDDTPVAMYDGKISTEIPKGIATDLQKAIFDVQKYYASNNLYAGLPQTSAADTAPKGSVVPSTVPTLSGSTGTAPPITSDNIVEAVKARKLAMRAQAKANGTEDSFMAASKKAEGMIASRAPGINITSTPQSTPVPTGQPPITKPITTETFEVGNKGVEYTLGNVQEKISKSLGYPVTVNVPPDTKIIFSNIKNVAARPELKDASAFIKGIVAVESGGNPIARSKAGAVGLMQLMPGTAEDLNVNPNNPAENVSGGTQYIQQQLDSISSALTKQYGEQGIPQIPDPRIALAAYNGGPKWIQRAIASGASTWEEIQQYLMHNKKAENAKENIDYANRVVAASLAFVKGGNASDDLLIKTYQNFGIINAG